MGSTGGHQTNGHGPWRESAGAVDNGGEVEAVWNGEVADHHRTSSVMGLQGQPVEKKKRCRRPPWLEAARSNKVCRLLPLGVDSTKHDPSDRRSTKWCENGHRDMGKYEVNLA
jgi:hypothetical protein